MKILVTSTSFQDSMGKHQDLLNSRDYQVDYARGPLNAEQVLASYDGHDGIICGDDDYSEEVLSELTKKGLKILSKYGVGLDKIDLKFAKLKNLAIRRCHGINHETVAEHTFALLLSYFKNIPSEIEITREGGWKRFVGRELKGKNLLIVGLGKIGQEVSKRAIAFGMNVYCYDKFIDHEFVDKFKVNTIKNLCSQEIEKMDIVSLHCNLSDESRGIINGDFFKSCRKGLTMINTARAGLVVREDLEEALDSGALGGYLTDVWFEEPMNSGEKLKDRENIFITPHIASRTVENVENQGLESVKNLFEELDNL